jgi:hypothetical protein
MERLDNAIHCLYPFPFKRLYAMPNEDSRKYRELKLQFENAETSLLHLKPADGQIDVSAYRHATDAYLNAKERLTNFMDYLRKHNKEICPNYDRVVDSIPGVKSRKCDVHPDDNCGGFTNRRGNCLGQVAIIQNSKKKGPFSLE